VVLLAAIAFSKRKAPSLAGKTSAAAPAIASS